MRDLGLRPSPGSGCYFQRFVAPDPRPRDYVPAATGLALHDGEAFEDLRLGRDVLPFRGSADGEVEAEVVFAGHGLRAPDQGLDDYRGLDVSGKVVLVLRGAPRAAEVRSALRGHRSALLFRSKMAAARDAGAVGFLLCDVSEKRARGEDLRVALRARGEAGVPAMWISRETARRIVARSGRSFEELVARADRGEAAGVVLEGARVRMRVRMGEPRPGLPTANVVGWLPGRSPELADEYVVVGAHYDHLGRGFFGSLGGDPAHGRLHPGADDNASGVAGLLAVAERLARRGARPPRSVVFVAFGAEEIGLAGSRRFLEDGPFPRERIVAMVGLTMIGRAATAGLSIQGVGSGRGLRGLVAEWIRPRRDLRVWLRDTTSLRSDHYVFLRRRIPALLFHTGLHDQFHTPADVSSLVQVSAAVRVADLAAATVRELATVTPAPDFTWPKAGPRDK